LQAFTFFIFNLHTPNSMARLRLILPM